jgi:hypothetical protein
VLGRQPDVPDERFAGPQEDGVSRLRGIDRGLDGVVGAAGRADAQNGRIHDRRACQHQHRDEHGGPPRAHIDGRGEPH